MTRAALSVVVQALLVGAGHAQTTPPPLPATTPTESHADVGAAAPTGIPTVADSSTAPRGRPGPPSAAARAGAGAPFFAPGKDTPEAEKDVVNVDAYDSAVEKNNTITLIGNVKIRYNGYTVTCDRASFDNKTRIITFEGNVALTTDRQAAFADRIQLNRHTQEFSAREGRSVVPQDMIGSQLLQPLRLSGETVGREGNNLVATNGLLTTCDFPDPHFKIGFARATVIPHDRIVLRKAVFYRYDRPIFRLDYLSLPIRDEIRYSYLPLVGRTDEEGYFVKNAVGYLLRDQLPGLLRVDVMQKKGVGLGFDQAYKFGEAAAGTAVLYSLRDRSRNVNTLNGRLNHQQRVGDILATISSDFQNNSYNALSTDSRTRNTSITATRAVGPNSTTASLQLGGSDSTGSKSESTQYTLTQSERIGTNGNITFRFNGSDNANTSSYGGVAPTTSGRIEQSGDVKANVGLGRAGTQSLFDMNIAANRLLKSALTGSAASGSGSSYYSGTQSLPDLTLATDSTRLGTLFLPGLFNALPLRFNVGYGNFLESATHTTTKRTLLSADASPRPASLLPGDALTISTTGSFKQTVYSADAAQYLLSERTQLAHKFDQASSLNFTYDYLRPYGGTPLDFRLDQSGSQNNAGANLTATSDRYRLTLGTSYDIQRSRQSETQLNGLPRAPWLPLSAQLALKTSAAFQTRLDTSYDINTGKLVSASDRIRIRGRGNFSFDSSLQYDPRQKKLSQITGILQTPVFSRDLRLSAYTGYNGLTKQFYYKTFSVVQSFHDYEYLFTYRDQPFGFRTERGFTFAIRLKAFPVSTQPVTGQYGTPVDTGTGEVF